jgi:hypothetical protein
LSFNDIFISNTLTSGAMTDFYGEEHFAWNLPDGDGGYFYTQPVSIGVTGGAVPDHPPGVLPLGGAHGHNIGLDAFVVFAPDIVPESERNAAGYMLHGNRFSGPDIDFAIYKGASILYTPSHEIRILTKGAATALPHDQNHARGGRLAGQPPSWVNARILQCLQQEYDD